MGSGPAPVAAISAHSYRATTTLPDGGIRYAWPERFAPEWYRLKEATMGPSIFESEENGNPIREGHFFRAAWFPAYRELPEAADLWYSWCDPAFGTSASGCYKVLAVVATDRSRYYVVDAWVRQTEPVSAMIEAWYRMFGKYPLLRHGGYENNFGQDDRLARDFQDAELTHGWPLPVSGSANQANKEQRIESLEPLASGGRIFWPIEPNKDVARLKHHMLTWPHGPDDGPDALESCIVRMRLSGAVEGMQYRSFSQRRFAGLRRRG